MSCCLNDPQLSSKWIKENISEFRATGNKSPLAQGSIGLVLLKEPLNLIRNERKLVFFYKENIHCFSSTQPTKEI